MYIAVCKSYLFFDMYDSGIGRKYWLHLRSAPAGPARITINYVIFFKLHFFFVPFFSFSEDLTVGPRQGFPNCYRLQHRYRLVFGQKNEGFFLKTDLQYCFFGIINIINIFFIFRSNKHSLGTSAIATDPDIRACQI